MSYDAIVARSWNDNQLSSVLFELTYRCNLDCFFCYNDLGLRGTPLTFAQYDACLRDLASMNVLNVTLSGGEPLAHSDFFRIGALARELGFVVRVKSNGHALRGELAQRLRDEVDPFVIEVSLHGARAETHDRQTRVAGSFVRLLENLREMLDLGLRLKVNSTLTSWNENETAEMYALCDELGLPLRFDLQVSPRDDGDRTPLDVAPTAEGIRKLIAIENLRYTAHPAQRAEGVTTPKITKHCGAGSAGIAIDPYGNVYPCVQWRRAAGSLHETSISAMWESAFDPFRRETEAAAGVVAAHPRGRLLNFCPGLADVLTGSATRVPEEMERVAEIVATS
ncbi:MAG TPA: radical SAM protein [Thermoanaerobaculia bacterium]|nr:radical SAM protein [Thermoanaerobaculia bacterium]